MALGLAALGHGFRPAAYPPGLRKFRSWNDALRYREARLLASGPRATQEIHGQALADVLRPVLAEAAPEVLAVYLYGSRARGTEGAASDVDLGTLLSVPPPPTLRSIARDIEAAVERVTRFPVQVVVLNRAPADLVHRVLRDGILLLDRDRAARLRFEVQSRNEYFDLAPIRRRYRRPPA